MGAKQSSPTEAFSLGASQQQNPFKLFEYSCPCCKAKRPIQYFHRGGVFLPQTPKVVCGECHTSVTVEPFKTVDYSCPSCKKWQKARMPGRPMPVDMYNVSVVGCNCGFRGEAYVGKLMDVVCSHCWNQRRELRDVWAEDGDEIQAYCECCQDYQRSFARCPRKKGCEAEADMEYTCENCFRTQSVQSQQLLRDGGVATCSLCAWSGYPDVRPRGQGEQPSKPHLCRKGGSFEKAKRKSGGPGAMGSTSRSSTTASGTTYTSGFTDIGAGSGAGAMGSTSRSTFGTTHTSAFTDIGSGNGAGPIGIVPSA